MQTAQDPVYSLNRGGAASQSTINQVLGSLTKIQRERDDAQRLLEVLVDHATPEKFEIPLKLDHEQLQYLLFAGLANEAGRIENQAIAMVLASSISMTEGEYMVFAPI